jgi:hypothetical protein
LRGCRRERRRSIGLSRPRRPRASTRASSSVSPGATPRAPADPDGREWCLPGSGARKPCCVIATWPWCCSCATCAPEQRPAGAGEGKRHRPGERHDSPASRPRSAPSALAPPAVSRLASSGATGLWSMLSISRSATVVSRAGCAMIGRMFASPVVCRCPRLRYARSVNHAGPGRGRSLATELLVSIDGFLDRKASPDDSRCSCYLDTCPDSQCLYRCGRWYGAVTGLMRAPFWCLTEVIPLSARHAPHGESHTSSSSSKARRAAVSGVEI